MINNCPDFLSYAVHKTDSIASLYSSYIFSSIILSQCVNMCPVELIVLRPRCKSTVINFLRGSAYSVFLPHSKKELQII